MLGRLSAALPGAVPEEHARSPRPFQAVYSPKRIADYLEQIHCPANDRLCEQGGLALPDDASSGPRSDMDQIAEAVRKVQKHAAKLVKA